MIGYYLIITVQKRYIIQAKHFIVALLVLPDTYWIILFLIFFSKDDYELLRNELACSDDHRRKLPV